jgi:NAD-dependent deacetylase
MRIVLEDGHLKIPGAVRERIRAVRSASVLTGAGVSAESGVPTFRGADGVWSKYDWRVLATREGFLKDPELVWEWYQLRQVEVAKARPNRAHEVIADMERHFESFAVLTQNIDGFHARAGSKRIIELHGNMWRLRCERDGTVVTLNEPVKEIPPLCQCGAPMRPDVVWFGEQLPGAAVDEASEVARTSELMFVVGTSAVVYPAAALPVITKNSGGMVIEVNTEPTEVSTYADMSIIGRAGEVMPVLWHSIA